MNLEIAAKLNIGNAQELQDYHTGSLYVHDAVKTVLAAQELDPTNIDEIKTAIRGLNNGNHIVRFYEGESESSLRVAAEVAQMNRAVFDIKHINIKR